ncbi:hypothetical protein SAMN05216320_102380 [Duganella sp. OV458]|nr:hypothetical protein SAMN05216320_102380 [Duganella sp. OV458]SDJ03284.1 hypothetical protein SAMN05428973_102171 [Duganella sp. OV510]
MNRGRNGPYFSRRKPHRAITHRRSSAPMPTAAANPPAPPAQPPPHPAARSASQLRQQQLSQSLLSSLLSSFLQSLPPSLAQAFTDCLAFKNSQISHAFSPLQSHRTAHIQVLQALWQAHHPINHFEKIDDTLPIPLACVQKLGQPPFGNPALMNAMPGLLRQQMRRSKQCKRIMMRQQFLDAPSIILQLSNGKRQPHFTAQQFVGIRRRPPSCAFIRQHGHASKGPAVTVIHPVVINNSGKWPATASFHGVS